jgi:hypothetical protein
MLKDVFIMDNERDMVVQSRAIFFTNEFEKIKAHYKTLQNLAIEANPSDKNYIEYLELEFTRAIEQFTKVASMIK